MDGRSLVDLIAQRRDEKRTVFSEMHSEGVYATCFMARRDEYKYIHIHGHAPQLFNLAGDPGEWINLAGRPEVRAIEEALRAEVLSQFDPDAIEQDVRESLRKRQLIKLANEANGLAWDYDPPFDASKLYWREG
jgi:choline-sulfatase